MLFTIIWINLLFCHTAGFSSGSHFYTLSLLSLQMVFSPIQQQIPESNQIQYIISIKPMKNASMAKIPQMWY